MTILIGVAASVGDSVAVPGVQERADRVAWEMVFLDSLLQQVRILTLAEEQYQMEEAKERKQMSTRENFLSLLVS